MIKVIAAGLSGFVEGIPLRLWLGLAAFALVIGWHVGELREERRTARADLKASIEREAARTGREADAATRAVLDCSGTWNRERGRCEP